MHYRILYAYASALLIALLLPQHHYAQFAVLPIGGDASAATGSASYSLGLPAYHHYKNTSLSVQEGLQQPSFNPSTRTNTPNPFELQLSPNPTADLLLLQLPSNITKPLLYRIVDPNGRTLQTSISTLENPTHIIDVHDLPSGLYHLLLLSTDHKIFATISFIKQ